MPSIESMEEEVNKENKVYKVIGSLDEQLKKKSAGTLQYSDFIASSKQSEADDIIK